MEYSTWQKGRYKTKLHVYEVARTPSVNISVAVLLNPNGGIRSAPVKMPKCALE